MDSVSLIVGLLSEAWPFVLLLALPLVVLASVHKLMGKRFPGTASARFVGLLARHPSLIVGVIGNALVLLLCVQFARYIEPGGYGRPMLEGLLFACIGLGTALIGVPLAIWQLSRGTHKASIAIGVALCLAPFPVGASLLGAIAEHYDYFIAP